MKAGGSALDLKRGKCFRDQKVACVCPQPFKAAASFPGCPNIFIHSRAQGWPIPSLQQSHLYHLTIQLPNIFNYYSFTSSIVVELPIKRQQLKLL